MALYDGILGAPKPDLVLLETYGYATMIKDPTCSRDKTTW